MNERYRYGYGDEPGDRDSTVSRQGSMTEQRDDQVGRVEADVDQRSRGEDEDEELRADRIREAAAEPRAGAGQPVADRERVEDADRADSTATSSVFDVEDEATGVEEEDIGPASTPAREPERADDGTDRDRSATGEGEARPAAPASDVPERPPIALGPPSRTEEPSAAAPSGLERPAPAGRSAAGAGTEMLVPGTLRPAPVTGPADDRSTLLSSLDPDATRARFLDIQAGFVDEPRQSVEEAERFVDELVHGLVQALENERAKLKAAIEDGSTEDLRLALRGYRAFVDRLLNIAM